MIAVWRFEIDLKIKDGTKQKPINPNSSPGAAGKDGASNVTIPLKAKVASPRWTMVQADVAEFVKFI